MAVNDFVSLLLGEAGGKNEAQRYNDMLHIASVVVNRSRATGLPVQDIIANQREFNAWGKALPAGTGKYRELAERAIKEVLSKGPVTDATFYATSAAKENLPNGLKAATKTESHEFFTDPQNRAIGTARGYVSPNLPAQATPNLQPITNPYADLVPPTASISLPQVAPVPASAPAQSPRTIEPGKGLANLLSPSSRLAYEAGLPPGRTVDLSLNGRRSDLPTSDIVSNVARAAEAAAPGTTVSLYSGMEPPGQAPVGARDRHPRGFAGDFQFYNGGSRVKDEATMRDIALASAAMFNANIGYGDPSYMGPGRMHIDQMPLSAFPGGAQWGNKGKEWADALEEARAYKLMPESFYERNLPPSMPAPAPRTAATPARGARAASEVQGYRSPAEQARFDAYADYGRSRSAPGARPATVDAVVSGRPGVSATGAGSISLAPPSLPDVAPVPFAPQMAAVDPLTTRAVPTPTPAPRATSVPAVDFPEAPKTPGRQAREAAAKGALVGALTGGPLGAVVGAALGPARSQIMGNIRSNMQGMGRVPVLSGVRDAYRGLLDFGGGGFGGMFSGIPAPNYNAPAFGVGSGYGAIGSVFGAPAGATAFSRSDPNISFTSLGNGYAVQHNSKYGTDITKEPGSYDAGMFSGRSSSRGKS